LRAGKCKEDLRINATPPERKLQLGEKKTDLAYSKTSIWAHCTRDVTPRHARRIVIASAGLPYWHGMKSAWKRVLCFGRQIH